MSILNPFKKKKNRRFNYTPRYYSGKSIGNIYDFDSYYKCDIILKKPVKIDVLNNIITQII